MQCSSTLTPVGSLQLTQLQQTIKQLEKDKDRLKLEKEAKATELELSRIEWQRDSATQLVSKMQAHDCVDWANIRLASDSFVVLAVGSERAGSVFEAGGGR